MTGEVTYVATNISEFPEDVDAADAQGRKTNG